MSWLSSLEKRFGAWSIPNLTAYLIVLQVIGIVLLMGGYATESDLFLHGSSVLHRGQWWRLVTFMMIPKVYGIWFLFAAYIFYIMGSALEQQWGTFRYNLFIWCGYLLTVAMSVLNPGAVVGNYYFLGCVFLAFATLFPHFELHLFFVLPVKVKWLGWLTAVMYVTILFRSPSDAYPAFFVVGDKLGVLAAFLNYALFFGRDVLRNMSMARRRNAFMAQSVVSAGAPRHECAECGITDKNNPAMDFRYCSTCGKCFCENHIGQHQHEGEVA